MAYCLAVKRDKLQIMYNDMNHKSIVWRKATHRYKYVHTYMCTQTDSSLLLFFSALHVSPSNTLLFYVFFTNSGSQLPGP